MSFSWLAQGFAALFLILLIFQDFRFRAVSWYLFPILFILYGIQSQGCNGWKDAFRYFSFNFVFVLIQLVLMTIYFSIKEKAWIFIADKMLGWGDILFLIILCLCFSPILFFLFYSCSLLFSLISWLLYKMVSSNKDPHIPLAGLMALFFLTYTVIALTQENPIFIFYNDRWVLHFFD